MNFQVLKTQKEDGFKMLVSSALSMEINWEQHLENDLFCRVGCKSLIQNSRQSSDSILTFLVFVSVLLLLSWSHRRYKAVSHASHRCGLLLHMSHIPWSVYVCLLGTAMHKPYNTAESTETALGRQTCVCERNHGIDWGVHFGATRRIWLNDPCARRCILTSNYFYH